MSQSGALGIAVINAAKEEGLGLSSFVSVGNKADLSGNDFLAFWDRDEQGRDVILLVPGVVRQSAPLLARRPRGRVA